MSEPISLDVPRAADIDIAWAESWFAYLEEERAKMAATVNDLVIGVASLLERVETQQRTIEKLERYAEEQREQDSLAITETLEKIRQALAALDKASEHAPQD